MTAHPDCAVREGLKEKDSLIPAKEGRVDG
jgi:hypothetical protein